MNAPTNIQVINGPDGTPAFVVIPYDEYMASRTLGDGLIPHDVISRTVDGATPARAWREPFGFTQSEIAVRMRISQSAYAQQENSESWRTTRLEKHADEHALTTAHLKH